MNQRKKKVSAKSWPTNNFWFRVHGAMKKKKRIHFIITLIFGAVGFVYISFSQCYLVDKVGICLSENNVGGIFFRSFFWRSLML